MKLLIALVAFLALFCVCDLAAGQCANGRCPTFTTPILAPTTSVPACAVVQEHGLGLNLPPAKAAATTTIVQQTRARTVAKSRAVARPAPIGPQLRLFFQRRRGHAREAGPGACQPAACTPDACGPLALPPPPVPVK